MPTLTWIGKDKVVNHQEVPYRVLEHKYGFQAKDDSDKPLTHRRRTLQRIHQVARLVMRNILFGSSLSVSFPTSHYKIDQREVDYENIFRCRYSFIFHHNNCRFATKRDQPPNLLPVCL